MIVFFILATTQRHLVNLNLQNLWSFTCLLNTKTCCHDSNPEKMNLWQKAKPKLLLSFINSHKVVLIATMSGGLWEFWEWRVLTQRPLQAVLQGLPEASRLVFQLYQQVIFYSKCISKFLAWGVIWIKQTFNQVFWKDLKTGCYSNNLRFLAR